jgi:hypothetical protein
MGNLLNETLKELKNNDKTPNDVKFIMITSKEGSMEWPEFESAIKNVNYDSGYGINEIHEDLVIVGESWWLERGEYDGSEWWDFKEIPKRPKRPKRPIGFINLITKT